MVGRTINIENIYGLILTSKGLFYKFIWEVIIFKTLRFNQTNNLFSTVSIICISRREQVMMEAMPEAILALAAANFSAGSEFGNVVRQNVGKARVKVCYIGISFFFDNYIVTLRN